MLARQHEILLTSFLLLSLAHGKQAPKLFFQAAQYVRNNVYLDQYDIEISPDHLCLDLVMSVYQELPSDLWVAISVRLLDAQSKKFRTVMAYDMDLCSLLGQTYDRFNIASAWLNNFWKYTNLTRRCPITPGFYIWNKLKPDKDSIPQFVPKGRYRMHIIIYGKQDVKKLTITNTTLVADVK